MNLPTVDYDRLAALCATRRLTTRQTNFVLAFVEQRNASAAYRDAYAVKNGVTARWITREASRMLRHPKIAPIVAELRNQIVQQTVDLSGITRANILAELNKLAAANIEDYGYRDDDGNFIVDLTGCTREQMAAIAEVITEEVTEGTGKDAKAVRRTRIKLHGKRLALVDMGKELGMFVDRKAIDITIVPPEVAARREAARLRMMEMLDDYAKRKQLEHEGGQE